MTVQLPRDLGGVGGGAILISSEGIIASPRLYTLAQSLILRTAASPPSSTSIRVSNGYERVEDQVVRNEWDYLDNIHIIKAESVEALEAILSYHTPAAIAQYSTSQAHTEYTTTTTNPTTVLKPILPIKLIILDSIAAPFRASTGAGSTGLIQRSIDMGKIGDLLKRLATLYSCAVVVVNQATDVFHPPPLSFFPLTLAQQSILSPHSSRVPKWAHEQHRLPELLYNRYQAKSFSGQSSTNDRSMAALGYSWSNTVNTRIMVSRTGRRRAVEGSGEQAQLGKRGEVDDERVLIRKMSLIFSPWAKRGEIDYVLESEGVRSV